MVSTGNIPFFVFLVYIEVQKLMVIDTLLVDAKRAEGLRIPVRPDIFYKDEWIDEDSFFDR